MPLLPCAIQTRKNQWCESESRASPRGLFVSHLLKVSFVWIYVGWWSTMYIMSQWMVILCSTDINVLKGYSQNYFIPYRWIINRDERENRREERGQTNPKCAFSWNKNNILTEHWTYLNMEEWCIFVSKTFQAFLCMWRWWW